MTSVALPSSAKSMSAYARWPTKPMTRTRRWKILTTRWKIFTNTWSGASDRPRYSHRIQSLVKRCHSSLKSFTGETISSRRLRNCFCRKEPLACAFSAQVGWGRLPFHLLLSNLPSSRNGFREGTVSGWKPCLGALY